jgi:hypothetical protein
MSKRSLTDYSMAREQPLSVVSGDIGPPQKCEALREAYKRHCSELVTIDEQQVKLLLVMLGIFSAGATFLASRSRIDPGGMTAPGDLNLVVKIGLTIITFTLLYQWAHYSIERHNYRQAVRDLLVRCELALGFYAKDAYLKGDALYTPEELKFHTKGGFMLGTLLSTVIVSGMAFLLILWERNISSCLK